MEPEGTSPAPSIGRFRVLEHLGKGGQGSVFRAVDPQLNREVALKVIKPKSKDGVDSSAIVEEARIAAQIAHPNVIPLFDVLEHGGQAVLVFEYVEGTTLKSVLASEGRFAQDRALALTVRIAVGIASAHEKGIVHLDLTPNNVMLCTEGRARVMDFGLARLMAGNGVEGQDAFRGTPRYITPEHMTGQPLSTATDIYALGLMLYEMLTGVPARNYDSISDLFDAVRAGTINWARLREHNVSSEVVSLLREMLRLEPEARIANATELVEELDRVIAMLRQDEKVLLALEFLKRRIRRQPEFPAFSNTLAEINDMTSVDSDTTFEDLGRVISRDFSMTNRVMKIANSAFFDRGQGGAATVAQAVSRLGLNTVRMVCNGVLVFDKFAGRNEQLKEALVQSFLAALIARGLVARHERARAEEAFIASLFHHLGRLLVMFYLDLEDEDIEALMAAGTAREAAEIETLGTPTWRLGTAVARNWHFPPLVVEAMQPVVSGSADMANDPVLLLRYGSGFANDLLDALVTEPAPELVLDRLMEHYCALCGRVPTPVLTACRLALEKFQEIAPALEVKLAESRAVRALAETLARLDETAATTA